MRQLGYYVKTMQQSHYLTTVREQYENYPYPFRDPADEKKRFLRTVLQPLSKINHYCFRGKQDFENSFRALIAGGGTGDATIYLAEQLRDTDAQIVYLDISTASMEVAQQRAQIRDLDNIEWIEASLLDLGQMGLGEFDFINCSGVLHHLENPSEGLEALTSVLKKGGAMGIMVYGKYGRTGVYQMQQLMQLANGEEPDMQVRLEDTKKILSHLPPTNWFKRGETLFSDLSEDGSDYEIFDMFLHSQDRAYTVLELYEWLAKSGLNLIDFVRFRELYRPEMFIKDPDLLRKIEKLPPKNQQAIAELITGTIKKHYFYASDETNTIADHHDFDNVPLFHRIASTRQLYEQTKAIPPGAVVKMENSSVGVAELPIGKYSKYIFKYMDGHKSLKEIFELVKAEQEFRQTKPSNQEVFSDFKKIYNVFNLLDMMVLRHQSVSAFRTDEQIQELIAQKYKK